MSYKELSSRMAEIMYLENIMELLDWDTKTYMPYSGIKQKSEELSILEKIIHKKLTKPKIDLLIKEALKTNLNPIQKRNIELWQRAYEQEIKLPEDFVAQLTKQISYTEYLWEKAKANSDFKLIQSNLEKILELIIKKAEYLDSSKEKYDVLLDQYERKLTMSFVDKYFEPLKKGVINIIQKIQNAHIKSNLNVLYQPATPTQQYKLAKLVYDFLKLDPYRTRLDKSEHPFTTGYGDDIRLTTHYIKNDPMDSFYTLMHEGGHALYALNLPAEHLWTAIGNSISMGIDESQSRFCENIIGKNPFFLTYIYPKIQNIVTSFKKVPLDEFILAVNAVVPSKIRMSADEVTYNLHIILRYEIERDLIIGRIKVNELPSVWNDKMEKYLGQKIENDGEGVLQDSHWYGGDIGYFPTYSLGNIYCSQMFYSLQKQIPQWKETLKKGDFELIGSWLRVNIHEKGSLYDPIDLLKKISNEAPNEQYFLNYLNDKFSNIYGY